MLGKAILNWLGMNYFKIACTPVILPVIQDLDMCLCTDWRIWLGSEDLVGGGLAVVEVFQLIFLWTPSLQALRMSAKLLTNAFP